MMPPNNPDDFDLELELRQALRRIEPRRDFSRDSYSRPSSWNRVLAFAAAIILMISLPVGVLQYQARQERRRQAGANLIKALQITQSKLQKTRQMVVRQLDRRNAI